MLGVVATRCGGQRVKSTDGAIRRRAVLLLCGDLIGPEAERVVYFAWTTRSAFRGYVCIGTPRRSSRVSAPPYLRLCGPLNGDHDINLSEPSTPRLIAFRMTRREAIGLKQSPSRHERSQALCLAPKGPSEEGQL